MGKVDPKIEAPNAGWSFENISDAFDEHVERSVPLYNEGHDLVCQLSDFFLPPDAVVTELGTSTGVLCSRFLKHNSDRDDIRYVGIDVVGSMVSKASERLANDRRAEFFEADVLTHSFERSSMVISYYCLQFIPPRTRQTVFDIVYNTLDWGGAFVLFEKVRAPDARFQDVCGQIYQEYKLQRNFNESEILNKQRSLKGVLEPFSTQGNLDLMKRAGFVDVMSIMKWVNFEGFLAIK
ncbi:methyltransferase domain-containing protein [Hoeflea sp. WL0058]|uniref:Methyltransferase domain-containing protein n=1 Tax=Flavimaribacter sediminis TaxID=2865987 RepID=A0AAE2ZLA0_9HYPH|nr:methyltransferase domain-containing protein [Flavimaribacter sediminis]MBW8638291.1 methyltransferase domain-containing protein [Flavimaribacter sediminis]